MLGARPAPTEFTVAQIAEYLDRKVTADQLLRRVRVRGEVTNFSYKSRGSHMYFDLKEGRALLRCVAWAENAIRLPNFGAGAVVFASGPVTTWQSLFRLNVDTVEIAGVGDVHAEFELRKRKLAAEGLFEAARKRPLPRFPFRIAIVSSKGAAGAGDFVANLQATRPHVGIAWCEATMQGARAPADVVGALGRASTLDVDAIVLTRGGGSFEDLFTFSDERIVRAVVAAKHPVISAIGHNIDRQLSDFAADATADTPSLALELIGPPSAVLDERLREAFLRIRRSAGNLLERQTSRLSRALVRSRLSDAGNVLLPQRQRLEAVESDMALETSRALQRRRERLAALEVRLRSFDPSRRLAERARSLDGLTSRLRVAVEARRVAARQRFDRCAPRLAPAVAARLERAATRRSLLEAQLLGSDPETILQKGYAIVSLDGAIVKDPAAVPIGASIAARVARGTLSARVEAKESHGN